MFVLLTGSACMTSGATAVQSDAQTEKSAEQIATEAAYAKQFETNLLTGWPQAPATYNEGSITMEMNSGAVLAAKDADTAYYPASITKIMTALLALENAQLSDKVTVSQGAVDCLESGASSIGLRAGEEITMEDALYALLLASANEAAYAIGETVGGTYEHFIEMMNDKAAELGCTNTHFVNANGLHDDNHYVTARDMALIATAAFQHEEMLTIMQTPQHTIPPTNLVNESRTFQQKHKMLKKGGEFYYEDCVGGKTGYTKMAMNTLVTYVDNGEMQIVNVSLRSHNQQLYQDTIKLLDYAQANFEKVTVSDNEKIKEVTDIPADSYVVVPKGVTFDQLEVTVERTADTAGVLHYTYEGNPVGNIEVAMQSMQPETSKQEKTPEKKTGFASWKLWKKILVIAVAVIVLAVVVLLGIRIYLIEKRKRERRRRRQQMMRRRRQQRMSAQRRIRDE